MSHQRKNNMRKLSFLGFRTQGDHHGTGGEKADGSEMVHLDDEMEDVFKLAEKQKFSVINLSDAGEAKPKRSMEHVQEQHRKKSYPHAHVPIKIRGPRRYSGTLPGTSEMAPIPTTSNGITHEDSLDSPPLMTSPTADTFLEASVTNGEPVRSPSPGGLEEEDQLAERHVQFDKQKTDDEDKDAQKKRKRSRHHAYPYKGGRKYSLQEEPQWKREARRVSIQPEDEALTEVDLEELDSHRSDDPRGLRRPKTQKPHPGTEFVRIGRKGGNENLQTFLTPTSLRKIYDHSPHAVFVQLDELVGAGEEKEWKETARWIKYEEDVEEGSDRWGRPHVATLSFHSLLNLRRCLQSGVVLLDLDEKDLAGVAYRITEQMVIDELISEEDKPTVMRSLLMRHKHVSDYEKGFKFSLKKQSSYSSLQNMSDQERGTKKGDATESVGSPTSHDNGSFKIDMKEETYVSTSQDDLKRAHNETIRKRIPEGAEATTVLVGSVSFLDQPTIAFIRLAQGIFMPSITEVTIPVRFMFILLGPSTAELDYHEVGRSISTLMSNRSFHEIAYKAEGRKDLLSAINEFLDDSIVLPPGNWESQALLPFDELKAKSEMIMKRKRDALNRQKKAAMEEQKEDVTTEKKPLITTGGDDSKKPPPFDPLQRTNRMFGGVINDIKRRYPLYVSDLTHGFNGQCLAASIFMYFAALCSAITFGGLLADKTENLMGISETLLSTSITGIFFALLAGQPLMVIGTTGPLLLFDQSLFMLSKSLDISFLTLRLWISIWLAVISAIVACAEGSVLAKKFTRFTEDIFSFLINLIFIMESVMKMYAVFVVHKVMSDYCTDSYATTALFSNTEKTVIMNETGESMMMDDPGISLKESSNLTEIGSMVMKPFKEPPIINQPNTALFCTVLTLGTFIIAYYLRIFRNSKFLGRSARRALGDFGVPIAIVIMVTLDYLVPQIYTEKLNVPEGLTPSDPTQRNWFIPFGGTDDKAFPVWIMFAAVVPAFMGYIIIFMETHIAELIIDKPERNLQKGSGLHLDIVVVSFLNMICGVIGAPWVCVATVRSISHVSALTVMSTNHAPGDKPYIVEVKEQRLSALIVSILVGASVSMAFLLSLIPLAVLFGIFLYMGISSLSGIQLFERIILMLKPVKHHPPVAYVKRVPSWKMHLYTSIQVTCLVLLYWIKSTSASLAFPFLLIMLVPLRAQMTHIFTPLELRALDGKQPDLDLEDEPDFYDEAPLPG